ncbi:hypothetical protein OIU34_22595 [Pararhizobium sp. BT-229]|uniref:hypothetical protein n=1 Tax=Pararhizobium sp. BT-229 TaxID=2986923 RepID=UPI0021F6FC83|nr:hypothetical protein [Pararhizobium sp. BT-229]MCV9964683.1 hypothetical protein [Pararhizobium sp. BT-229]
MTGDMFAQPHCYETPVIDSFDPAMGMAAHVFGTAAKLVGASMLVATFVMAFPPLVPLLALAAAWDPGRRPE